jgi:hypothetical protein
LTLLIIVPFYLLGKAGGRRKTINSNNKLIIEICI